MVYICKVPKCDQKRSSGMFSFPSAKTQALVNWKLALKIPESQAITANWKVCFKHFPSSSIEAKVKVEYSLKNREGKIQ